MDNNLTSNKICKRKIVDVDDGDGFVHEWFFATLSVPKGTEVENHVE